ncbi:MAG: radical SAM protein, partial [Planctomycetota bacterium]|nr:radical SAM protein [Planctomycetota bacterium]
MKKSTAIPMRLSPLAVRPDGGRRRFHLMIKPGGSACNLACDYCYYLHKGALPGQDAPPSMPPEVLERVISQYIGENEADEVVFSWQGGEPTLLGIGFFEHALTLQRKHASGGKRVSNTLQTNGVLLDDDWAAFLKRHDFRVGLSVDGPEALHDRCRRDAAGNPTR